MYQAMIQPMYSYYTPSVVPLGRHRSVHGEVNRRREVGKASSFGQLTSPTSKGTALVYGNFTFICQLGMLHPVGGVVTCNLSRVDILKHVATHKKSSSSFS